MSSARRTLQVIARRAMTERGLEPSFPPEVLTETKKLTAAPCNGPSIKDLRGLLWCSIDNDDSRDLDQLSVAAAQPGGDVKVMVAIADVDAAVGKGSPVDRHDALATTSVYTPGVIFPRWSAAAGGSVGARHGPAAPHAGSGGAGARRAARGAWRARLRDD